jgi:hypothetical protein
VNFLKKKSEAVTAMPEKQQNSTDFKM